MAKSQNIVQEWFAKQYRRDGVKKGAPVLSLGKGQQLPWRCGWQLPWRVPLAIA